MIFLDIKQLLRKVFTVEGVLRRVPHAQDGHNFVAHGKNNAMRWSATDAKEKLTHVAIK